MSAGAPVVAISGAASFTGLWIARAFQQAGWAVHALCSRQAAEYRGLRAMRVRLLHQAAQVHFGVRAEHGGMATWLCANHPTIWIHHHHWMQSFRSPEYDMEQARRIGIDPLPALVTALAESSVAGVIFSGTFFEPGEGGRAADAPATPYAQSKRAVWLQLQELGATAGVPLSKVVIPNPIGALENEDRIVPVLLRACVRHEPFTLSAPDAISDYLPMSVLAKRYVAVASDLLRGIAQIRRPSGRVCSVRDWVAFVLFELATRRLGLTPCPIQVSEAGGPGRSFRNSEPPDRAIDWDQVWDEYAGWIRELGLLGG